eukprot:EG_transcript_26503
MLGVGLIVCIAVGSVGLAGSVGAYLWQHPARWVIALVSIIVPGLTLGFFWLSPKEGELVLPKGYQADALFYQRLLVGVLLLLGLLLGVVGLVLFSLLEPAPPTPYIHPEWYRVKYS